MLWHPKKYKIWAQLDSSRSTIREPATKRILAQIQFGYNLLLNYFRFLKLTVCVTCAGRRRRSSCKHWQNIWKSRWCYWCKRKLPKSSRSTSKRQRLRKFVLVNETVSDWAKYPATIGMIKKIKSDKTTGLSSCVVLKMYPGYVSVTSNVAYHQSLMLVR